MLKTWTYLLTLSLLFLTGCVDTPDKYGWSNSQKEEFLTILEEDKYLSICDKTDLYQQIKKTEESPLMSRMLVHYANNLANSCIDTEAFEEIQKKRVENNISTAYEMYFQEVDQRALFRGLRAGEPIDTLLKPYIPKNEQFLKLTQAYHLFEKDPNRSDKLQKKLRINIERLKLFNDTLGENYALVNIPEFKVRVKEANRTTMEFRVIVGKRKNQTPIFTAPMKYITLNPQWGVPDSIARNEIIPKLLDDEKYLERQNLVVRKNYFLDSEVIRPEDVNWSVYLDRNTTIPFKFIEVPSEKNILGRVKFIFPNKYAVYMHDTQTKYLFKRSRRLYSHGCVRLEKPMEMFQHFITNFSDENLTDMKEKYDKLETHHVRLKKRVMVHTIYLTTYIDNNGKLLLFQDVYDYDKYQKLKV